MLASKPANLFNDLMQTEQHRTPPPGPALTPVAPSASEATRTEAAEADWQPRKDIMNQMLAYRDWWNMPARRPAKRGPRATLPPRPAERA